VLNNACGLANVETELLDAHGERVDLDSRGQCDRGYGCGGADYLAIELPPGGVARIPFAVDARKLTLDDECERQRKGAVAPGTYDLHVDSRLGELHAKVRVR
jgi:hypothetical protein